jgi:RNA polymerase sigma-70 factor (ECF subfamily)
VSSEPAAPNEGARTEAFLALYDSALPYVYGYLLARCGRATLAEELTAETMLAAVDAFRRQTNATLSTGWLLGVARHKLIDYWRRLGREERSLRWVAAQEPDEPEDPWDVHLDTLRARATLEKLAAQHRTVLTLRYLDDLPVAQVADILDRTLHATEALLVRARAAFRRAYSEQEDPANA